MGRLICTACGSVFDDDPRDEKIAQLEEDLELANRDLASKRKQVRRLQAEQDRMYRDHPQYELASAVLSYWKDTLSPKAKELTGDRLRAVFDRLNAGYTADELMQAIDGYATRPYVVNGRRSDHGARDELYVDAALIFRDAEHVDTGLRWAERAEEERSTFTVGSHLDQNYEKGGQLLLDRQQPAQEALPAMLEAALKMAGIGFHIFPCKEREKQPATAHGLKDATIDEERISRWWMRHQADNIAVATGTVSGCVVLDVDGSEGYESLRELEARYDELPTTLSVKTPRGGQHYYFRHPGGLIRNRVNVPAESLDIRGDGGYVLVPPSVGPGGRKYVVDDAVPMAFMPDWLHELLRREEKAARQGRMPDEWEQVLGQQRLEGDRNDELTRYVGLLVNQNPHLEIVRGQAHVYNEARMKPRLPAQEVDRTVESVWRIHHAERRPSWPVAR